MSERTASQSNSIHFGMVAIAVVTLLGHAGTWLQNHSSSKIVSEIKTDVNSKSDKAAAMIESQNNEIKALLKQVSALEERLMPKAPAGQGGSVILTDEQFQRLLNSRKP